MKKFHTQTLKTQVREYQNKGIRVMPVKSDKRPILTQWTAEEFFIREEDFDRHIDQGAQVGIITGKHSGITVIDIDLIAPRTFGTDPDTFPATFTVRTPSGGVQKYYQYDERIPQSQKGLKMYPSVDIRNDGGQVVAPPSHAVYTKTYENGDTADIDGAYIILGGTIDDLAPFPYELFESECAPHEEPSDTTFHYTPSSARPGDDFEASAPWESILSPHGFTKSFTDRQGSTHWARPGKKAKEKATSMTTRMCTDGRERLFVFSTNAQPFEPYNKHDRNSYNKVKAYALLNHDGHFMEAVNALREQGYGVNSKQQDTVPEDEDIPEPHTYGGMTLSCVADIEEEPIDWVWRGKIARGELCIIAGEPGAGKTMIAMDIASRISNGHKPPYSTFPMTRGHVVFLTSENDPTKVLRPRLIASGADLTKIHLLSSSVGKMVNGKKTSRHVALAEDSQAIGEAMDSLDGVVMLVIDPISEYMGKKDANNNAEVRDVLATLTEHVRSRNVAVLAVTHFNKKVEVTSASSRINGSIGFAGSARTAFAVGKYSREDWSDEESEEKRDYMAFTSVKNNLSGDKGGYVYHIVPHTYETKAGLLIETAKVEWLEEMQDSADEMLSKNSRRGRPPSELNKCRDWLKTLLEASPDGVRRQDVIDEGMKHEFSRATIDRASHDLYMEKLNGVWKLKESPLAKDIF